MSHGGRSLPFGGVLRGAICFAGVRARAFRPLAPCRTALRTWTTSLLFSLCTCCFLLDTAKIDLAVLHVDDDFGFEDAPGFTTRSRKRQGLVIAVVAGGYPQNILRSLQQRGRIVEGHQAVKDLTSLGIDQQRHVVVAV